VQPVQYELRFWAAESVARRTQGGFCNDTRDLGIPIAGPAVVLAPVIPAIGRQAHEQHVGLRGAAATARLVRPLGRQCGL